VDEQRSTEEEPEFPPLHEITDELILSEAKKFLQARGLKGIVLFVMITGSSAYNLSDEHSDLDFLGVYMAPCRDILAIDSDHKVFPAIATRPKIDPKPDVVEKIVHHF
jgi:hypothetical protein